MRRKEPLVRNVVTQNTPDIHASGMFRLAERTYGNTPYRSAPLYLFDKLEFSSLNKTPFSMN